MVALAPLAAAAELSEAPVVVVPASDPRIQYIGRFDVSNPDAPRFAWSGSFIKARYKAERITLLLKDDPPANRTDDSGAPFRNWFDVLINGHLAVTIIASPDRTRYEIPRPLGNGPHTISVFKRTEAVVGVCTFLGQFMADLPGVGQDVAFTQSQEVVQFGNPVLHVHGAVATGLPWSCGDFRHTFGSQLAQKGESLYKIATLMGNSPDICRRHYAALIPEEMHDTVEFAKPNGDEDPPKDKTQALLEEVLKRLDEKTQPDADSVGAGEGDPPSSKPKPGARKPMTRIPWGHGLQNTN